MAHEDRLRGKVIAVTGAASGLGEASARQMVAEGARVVLGDIQDAAGAALADELGPGARYLRCDVTQESDVAALVDAAMESHGRLDCMFNNAGIIGAQGPIDELVLEEYEQTMAVLLRSVVLGCKHAARVMKPQGSGVIVSTSSVAGIQGGLGGHVYATAKAAIVGLTRNVAAELGAWNIRVNAIAPGKILTPINAGVLEGGVWDKELAAEAFKTRTPLRGRIGVAEDIANAACWLASDESAFISGQTLIVDGGLTTGSPENVGPGEHGRWARRPT